MSSARHRARRRWRGVAAAALAAGLVPAEEAGGYRFFERTVNDSMIPRAADALRWSADVWGPLRSLEWVVSDSPGWTEPWEDADGEMQDPPFEAREEALPYIVRALAAWSSVPTAAIHWRAAGLGEELHRARDHTNAVRVHERDVRGSYAALYTVDGELVECDVSLSPASVANLDGWGMNTLIHEFGHCLGLAHSGMFSTWDAHWRRRSFGRGIWFQDPKMSYGYDRTHDLSHDDGVAASLLRPAAGWLGGTGSITGEVSMAGAPARFVRVIAARISGGGIAESTGVFTDEEGRYRLEGLAPGEYLLNAGTMIISNAHSRMFDGGATTDGRDQYLLTPITVSAGGLAPAPEIALHPDREVSSWREPSS